MAKLYTFGFVISAFIPLIFGQCTIEKAEPLFRRAVYDFSINLASRIAQDTDNHFVSSTLSAWSLIAPLSLGAEDKTLQEIKNVLRLHHHRCFNYKYYDIVKKITSANDGTALERSSTLFVDDRLSLKKDFSSKIQKAGICNIKKIFFENFVSAATIINDYVSNATRGSIDDIISPNDLEGVYLILIDALYFRGTWKVPFPSSDTETSAFYDERQNQIGDVNLMFLQGRFNIASINQLEAKILELPYGTNGRFAMLIFLPYTDVSLSTVIDSLKYISLNSIFKVFNRDGPQTIFVQIPRFTISSDLDNLKELLDDMGLKSMFDVNQADFPYISDYSLYISGLIQKARIEVNEEGTSASAASEATFESRTLPEQFIANKPFLFMVVDKQTEVALFTGAYSKPVVY